METELQKLGIYPPHPKLAHLMMHVLSREISSDRASNPFSSSYNCAGLSPSFTLVVRGSGKVSLAEGKSMHYPRFFLRGPYLQPSRTDFEAGSFSISVSLRPGVLYQATGILPETILSNFVSMTEIADDIQLQNLFAAIDHANTVEECVALFQQFLLTFLDHQKKPSMGMAFVAAHQKMFSPMLDLALYFGIGSRQIERRVREAFGVNLRDGRRIGRFALCLLRLLEMPVARGDLTTIAQDAGYYDQAHMHKEFIEFAGLSPTVLIEKIANDDPAFWVYRMRFSDIKKLFADIDP